MTKYEIRRVKDWRDYSFAVACVHQEIDGNPENGDKTKKIIKLYGYNPKKEIFTFSSKEEIIPSAINPKLSERGLILRVLK